MTEFTTRYLLPLLLCCLLIFKPGLFANFLRHIYCQLSSDPTMDKEKATEKMYFTKKTFFFRYFGFILLMLLIYKFFLEVKGI